MGRPAKKTHNGDQAADIAFMEDVIALVKSDGHTLSLTARKKLIDAIERFLPVTDSDRNLPLLTGNGQSI